MVKKRCWDELPSELWEVVFDRVHEGPHQRHLEPLSLVCKCFLSVTNTLKHTLSITDLMILVLQSPSCLLRRFHNLKRINLDQYDGDLNQILSEIASSNLSLETLNLSNQKTLPCESLKKLGEKMKLKSLICSRLKLTLFNKHLNVIGSSFPHLEELDISNPMTFIGISGLHSNCFTDEGIEKITLHLKNLRKVDIAGNYSLPNRSLAAFSKNCRSLEDISLIRTSLKEDDVGNFLRDSPNLVSLKTSVFGALPNHSGLRVVDLNLIKISKQHLQSIVEANLPLQKLTLSRCSGLGITAVSALLKKYQSLNHLDLVNADLLTDYSMERRLSPYLCNLKFLGLNRCYKLTISTFFTIVQNCVLIEEIQMESTSLGKGISDTKHTHKVNSSIRTLKLGWNKSLGDECLTKILSVCPNLVSLDVRHCLQVTKLGIQEAAKICSNISELGVNECKRITNLGKLKFSKLEVLRAARSGIRDEGLRMVGKNCSSLICLGLEDCLVSDKGVEEVVGKCKRLREVNLSCCYGVSVSVVAWMIIQRPTLRKIVPPPDFRPTETERDLFLRHWCTVSYN